MRVLAVDFGEKRIGLAVSDEAGDVVVAVGTVSRASDAQAAAEVVHAAKEREVRRLVVGLPGHGDGREGLLTRRARSFARRLADLSGLPVDLHGEGLTSVEAERALRSAGVPRGRRSAARDAEAAAVLLRDWLASRAGAPSAAP